ILFEPTEMLAPPKDLVGNGRANPAGIPYLYVASDEVTAVSEIRPHTGEIVNVAEIQLETSLKLIDLREPRKRASPIELFWVLGDIGKLHREVIFFGTFRERTKSSYSKARSRL
ncbi:RES family NAD+ phosphorylase, partial [Alkalimonas mucilaginosa]